MWFREGGKGAAWIKRAGNAHTLAANVTKFTPLHIFCTFKSLRLESWQDEDQLIRQHLTFLHVWSCSACVIAEQ